MFTEKRYHSLIKSLRKLKDEACEAAEYDYAAAIRDAVYKLERGIEDRKKSEERSLIQLGEELLQSIVNELPITIGDPVWVYEKNDVEIPEDNFRVRAVIIEILPEAKCRLKTELNEFPVLDVKNIVLRDDGVKI